MGGKIYQSRSANTISLSCWVRCTHSNLGHVHCPQERFASFTFLLTFLFHLAHAGYLTILNHCQFDRWEVIFICIFWLLVKFKFMLARCLLLTSHMFVFVYSLSLEELFGIEGSLNHNLKYSGVVYLIKKI